ncbi:hypothetical protein VTO73DRAFT_900 [Trametes versicolor]
MFAYMHDICHGPRILEQTECAGDRKIDCVSIHYPRSRAFRSVTESVVRHRCDNPGGYATAWRAKERERARIQRDRLVLPTVRAPCEQR